MASSAFWRPTSASNSSHLDSDETVKERQLRGCADPRDDEFLNRLVSCTPSKFLVSTRLFPQAFTGRQGDLMRACAASTWAACRQKTRWH